MAQRDQPEGQQWAFEEGAARIGVLEKSDRLRHVVGYGGDGDTTGETKSSWAGVDVDKSVDEKSGGGRSEDGESGDEPCVIRAFCWYFWLMIRRFVEDVNYGTKTLGTRHCMV